MNRAHFLLQKLLVWTVILLFVLFYPMLISIYVFLPLFTGVMGYMLILGMEKGKITYVIVSLLYLLNLDVNLSLPFFLASIAILFVYIFFYPHLIHFRKCKVCTPFLSVLLIDVVYLAFLMAYDFIFQADNIILDDILLYPLVVDLLVAVIL
jgi:hypothetical protein